MTNEKLLELLREAQPWIQVHAPIEATDLLMRMNAALAERQDSAQDAVEWSLHDSGTSTARGMK